MCCCLRIHKLHVCTINYRYVPVTLVLKMEYTAVGWRGQKKSYPWGNGIKIQTCSAFIVLFLWVQTLRYNVIVMWTLAVSCHSRSCTAKQSKSIRMYMDWDFRTRSVTSRSKYGATTKHPKHAGATDVNIVLRYRVLESCQDQMITPFNIQNHNLRGT